jgi:hypothetical protein
MAMSDFRRLTASTAMLIGMLMLPPAKALAFDLTGAWASGSDQCSQIFRKTGNQIVFIPDSDVAGSGFIADANQLTGRMARCTIKARKQTGDTVNIMAACATDIMLSSVPFSVKVLDEDRISRLFPGMEDMEVTFYRCKL